MDFFYKFIFLTVSSGLSCWGFQQLTEEESTKLERFVALSVQCSGAHAASVSLIRNSTVLYRNGYGHGSPPIDKNTTFCIGGLTKLFTAVLLSKLIDARNSSINFDTPIQQILGDDFLLSDKYRSKHVTLRDILNQKTGISNMEAISQMNSIKTEDMMGRLMYAPETFKFREKIYKSNPLFLIVQKIIEILGGKSYEKLLKEHILEPLGMTGTTFLHTLHSGRRNLAMPTMNKKGERYTVPVEAMRGFKLTKAANGICSNAHDMSTWINMHLMKGVSHETTRTNIRSEILNEINRTGINRINDAFNLVKNTFLNPAILVSLGRYGYGTKWESGLYRGLEMRTHSGSIPGYESMMSILPDQKVGVFLTMTGIGGSKATVIKSLFNMFVLDLLLGKPARIDYTNVCLMLDDLVAHLERQSYQSRPNFKPRIWKGENDQKDFRKDIYASVYKNRMFGDVTVSYNRTTDKLFLTYGKTGLFELNRTSTKDMFLLQALKGLPYYISNADGYQGVLYGYLYFNRTSSNNSTAQDIISVTIPDFDPQVHPTFRKTLKPINMLERYGPNYLNSYKAMKGHFILLLVCVLISIALINPS
ncbi:uncharacterized protein LOC115221601 [Octopus sinensis]|uniref:Uncharacterized protein LOC115221601 n=1 Tax=Octopus sinensis TaxID=2607531 RepID=A0A6P7TDI5_9MOLL|nr:uncharacterized protein LOC115221601 [Octopus sinensis]